MERESLMSLTLGGRRHWLSLITTQFLQTFFSDAKFSKYKTRNFGLWVESYGGHYGPVMAS
jgi:hypothetical protein